MVKAYSGSRADEIPRFITLNGQEFMIKEVIPLGLVLEDGERRREFLVKLENGKILKLVQWENRWSVLEYRRSQETD